MLIAGEQHGCVTLAQAKRCRLSHKAVQRRVETRRWARVLPGVFVVRGSPDSWEQRLWAAVLWVGDGGAVAGAAAAALWEFPGFPPGPVEVTHPGSKQTGRGVVVHRAEMHPGEVTRIGALRVTTAARTLADIAARVDDHRLDVALHHCLHRRIASIGALEEIARRRSSSRSRGSARLARIVSAYSDGQPAASPLEVAVYRRLQAAGLPEPRRQHGVWVGGRRRYLDFAWPEDRVAVEVDGYRWHSSRAAWEADRERLADLRRGGWTVIHVTKADLDHGFDEVVAEIQRHL